MKVHRRLWPFIAVAVALTGCAKPAYISSITPGSNGEYFLTHNEAGGYGTLQGSLLVCQEKNRQMLCRKVGEGE